MTEYERIKAMSVEEMAVFILSIDDCPDEVPLKYISDKIVFGDISSVKDWLMSEVED